MSEKSEINAKNEINENSDNSETRETNETGDLIGKAAAEVFTLARSLLLVRLRFLDLALGRLEALPSDAATLSTDGIRIYYGPAHVLKSFKEENERPVRDYLHAALHCIFSHMFVGSGIDKRMWDLACDIAVESTINDLDLDITASSRAAAQRAEAGRIRPQVNMLTAEKLYRWLLEADLPEESVARLEALFAADDHTRWGQSPSGKNDPDGNGAEADDDADGEADTDPLLNMPPEELIEEWKDIAEKVEESLETFFREQGDENGGLMQNLKAVTREHYDYSDFLRKFAVFGESVMVNDEEFDYIFYTYGLELYGNMPLVEPLEYKEIKRIREFVIAVDTSGSTSGPLVQKFLQKTYNILKSTESYFSRVNIHIIQCDAEIQEHVKISSEKEFDDYIENLNIHGLGGTDFRPVFSLVDELMQAGEFTNLKGLIYFTDGFGTYPPRKPVYDTAFVFLNNEYNAPEVPPWAIRLVLQDEEIEEI